jgi:hypothetical protein
MENCAPVPLAEAMEVPVTEEDGSNRLHEDSRKRSSKTPACTSVHVNVVPWLHQFRYVLRKNFLLLSRRPVIVFLYLASPAIFVGLAALPGKDIDKSLPLTDCGSVEAEYLESLSYDELFKAPLTLNHNWSSGGPVSIMTIGPMLQAISVYIVVQNEMQTKLLGVLRLLGLRDSVYWASWFAAFSFLSLLSAILAGIVASALPIHVFQHVDFGLVFASIFCLQETLIPASFFLATLNLRKVLATLMIAVMILAPFVPLIAISVNSWVPDATQSLSGFYGLPTGIFWAAQNSTGLQTEYTFNSSVTYSCDRPIMVPEYGRFMTEEEQAMITPDDYFFGCSVAAGYGTTLWNRDQKFGLGILFLFPYFHFYSVWGNILGYTAMPDRKFSFNEAKMGAEELALKSLPGYPFSKGSSNGSSLWYQGVTLRTSREYDTGNGPVDSLSTTGETMVTCPPQDTPGLCKYVFCDYAIQPVPLTGSPSANGYFGYLTILVFVYAFVACYVAQIFPSGNGARRPWFFPLIPSYWIDNSNNSTSSERATVADAENGTEGPDLDNCVSVNGVRMKLGNVDALDGVSLTLARGEVTALLGM